MPGPCAFPRRVQMKNFDKKGKEREKPKPKEEEEEEEFSSEESDLEENAQMEEPDIGLDDLEGMAELSEQDMNSDSEDEEEEAGEGREEGDEKDDEEESEDEEEEGKKDSDKPSRRQRMKQRLSERRATESRTVFVGNAPPTTTRKTITKMFKNFGTIEAVYQRTLLQMTEKLTKLMQNKDKTLKDRLTSTNFFVRFANSTDAQKAAEQMNGTELDGHTLRVRLSTQHKFESGNSIFLGNLSFTATDDQVRAHFIQCGPISGVRLLHDKETGLGTGAGYVQFEKKDSVAKALELDGRKLGGRELRVSKMVKKKKRPAAGGGAMVTKQRDQRQKQRGRRAQQQKQQQRTAGLPRDMERLIAMGGDRPRSADQQRRPGGRKDHPQQQQKATLSKRVRKDIKRRRKLKGGAARKSLIN